jgi:hypothetical protein
VFRQKVRLILRPPFSRKCASFCASGNGLGKVLLSHLEIVLLGDGCAIAKPIADDMQGELCGQLGLPRGPHVLE